MDQAFADLRQHIKAWADGTSKPDIRVFVYPPEWEAVMLDRFPRFADECEAEGRSIELVDVGHGFANEIRSRRSAVDRMTELEKRDRDRVIHDLGVFSSRYIERVLTSTLDASKVCRILINTGALATFTSYSAIANGLQGRDLVSPAVLAFPGEGDERSLSLIRLRVDTNYRVPRI